MSGKQFSTLTVFSIAGVISALLVAGCGMGAPDATPVPLATWIAQGVPEDTVIQCALVQSYKGRSSSVTIEADGTVNSTITDAVQPDSFAARGTGLIS